MLDPRAMRVGLLKIGLLAALIGCGGSEPMPGTATGEGPILETSPAPGLTIRQPLAHLMPGMGAVYLSIVNTGDFGDRLVSIETTAARAAELHETVEEDGVLRMRAHPDGFEIPPGGVLELQPGGKHVMLVEPRQPIVGEAIRLTLHFEHGGMIEVDVPVTTPSEMTMGAEH